MSKPLSKLVVVWVAVALSACGSDPEIQVRLTSPSSGLRTNGTVTVQAAVTGAEPEDVVELLRNGSVLVALPPPYTYTWNTASDAEGTYELVARLARGDDTFQSDPVTVEVDRTPPQLSTFSPGHGDDNVWVGQPIVVTFSEPLNPATVTGTAVAVRSGGATLRKTLALDAEGRTLTLTLQDVPSTPAAVSVTFGASIQDLAGNPLPVAAEDWSWTYPAWQLPGGRKPVSDDGSNWEPSLTFDAAGTPVLAWTQQRAGGWFQLRSAAFRDGAWVGLATLDNAVGARLARGEGKVPVLAHSTAFESGSPSSDVQVRRLDADAWQPMSGPLDRMATNSAVSSAIFGGERPLVAFSETTTNTSLYVSRWAGGSWTPLSTNPLDRVPASSIQFAEITDSSVYGPVAVWAEQAASGNAIYVSRWNDTSWVPMGDDLRMVTTANANAPAVTIGTEGHPVVVWCEPGAATNIYAKRWSGLSWSLMHGKVNDRPVDHFGLCALSPPSVVSRANGTPVVAFAELAEAVGSARHVVVKEWNGMAWNHIGPPLDLRGGSGVTPRLAIDDTGVVWVTWAEPPDHESSPAEIFVARRNALP